MPYLDEIVGNLTVSAPTDMFLVSVNTRVSAEIHRVAVGAESAAAGSDLRRVCLSLPLSTEGSIGGGDVTGNWRPR